MGRLKSNKLARPTRLLNFRINDTTDEFSFLRVTYSNVLVFYQASTNLGHPIEIYDLGTTSVPEDLFHEYLGGLKESVFE